jgi:hypothetical protein
MGVSKRIAAIPRGFEIGETWIYLAHNEAGTETSVGPGGAIITKKVPAVFYLFKPQRIEKIITKSQSENEAEMQKLTELGITPVIVPDNDPDHQGSVHDKDE